MEDNNMTESLPKVRCTPEMRNQLVAFARASVSSDLADHIREAVRFYVSGGMDFTSEEVERVRQEMEKALGQTLSKGELITKLINHWDITKRDSYGYQQFS